jgi:hypothetical protein
MSIEDQILKEVGLQVIPPKKKDDSIRTSYFETDEYILEQITTHTTHATRTTEPEYLLYDKATEAISVIPEFEWEGQVYKPVTGELLTNKVIKLPTGTEEFGSTGELVNEIREFFNVYFELPSFYEAFMPYLVLYYWVYEKFPFVPYVHFVGRTATGKSTAMAVFGSICYKSIDASGAITLASIFRVASQWKGTLLLDEFTNSGDNYQEMIAFLKSGVADNAVLRVEGDKEKEVKAYMVKSPKIFTSESPITDAGLQSRTIVIRMEKNKRKIPLYRLKSYEDQAAKLRNKLLLWRFRHLNKINLKEIEYGYEELKGFDSRVQQVITPIYYFSDENCKNTIVEFAKQQQEETFLERKEALDGVVYRAMASIFPTEPPVKLVTEKVNAELGLEKQISEKKVGNVIRKILGFDIKRLGNENISTVLIDSKKAKEKIKELDEYYGISSSVASVACVASVAIDPEQVELEDVVKTVFVP